jgi:hypothetical protein
MRLAADCPRIADLKEIPIGPVCGRLKNLSWIDNDQCCFEVWELSK